jgi:hypothetical protein
MVVVPWTTSRARSLSRRPLARAWPRSRATAYARSSPPRSARIPLDCSVITRVFSAVCVSQARSARATRRTAPSGRAGRGPGGGGEVNSGECVHSE